MKNVLRLVAAAGLLLGVAACSKQAPAPAGPPFQVTATIRELMDAEVDPAADGLWDSVGFVATTTGAEDRQPRTDEEWLAVRRHALTLVESTNLLMIEGRAAAPPGTKVGEGELATDEITRQIAARRASFNGFAQGLRQTALKALAAIDAKDPKALFEAGGPIDEACEACHVSFWYPNQKTPGT